MRKAIEAGNTYTVYVGGTDTKKTNVATISASAVEYKVTFMNGTSEFDKTDTKDGIPQLPTSNPTKAEDENCTYEFEGWYTDENCTTKFDSTKAITANTTVYANFTAIPKSQGGTTVTHKLGDIDGDNAVGVIDINAFVAWGTNNQTSTYPIGEPVQNTTHKLGDIDGDGAVGVIDINAFVAWGTNNQTSTYPIGEVISGDYLTEKD